jgi:hypothetical protein
MIFRCRYIVVIICTILAVSLHAQVNVTIESTHLNDGALVLEGSLTNITQNQIAIEISNTKTLLQLPYPQKEARLDSALRSAVPVTFVVFYDGDNMIDEPVAVCDGKLPGTKQVSLAANTKHNISIESRCFSQSVIRLLNSRKSVKAELYVLYRMDNILYIARSAKKKIKIKK